MIDLPADAAENLAFRQHVSGLLNLPYVAHDRQLQFHLSERVGRDYPVLFGGGMYGGKTAALCAEAIRECLEVEDNRILMARKELVTFKASTLETLMRLIPDYVVHRPSSRMFIFPNTGSHIHYTGVGSEKDKTKLQSTEWGGAFIDEAPELDLAVFTMIQTRVRWGPAQRANRLKIRLTANPEPGWIKERFITDPSEKYVGGFIPSLASDNPYGDPTYIETLRSELPDEWFRAYMLGDWDAFVPTDTILSPDALRAAMYAVVSPGMGKVWGADIARFGKDRTVLASRSGGVFEILDSWAQMPVDETARTIVTQYQIAKQKPDRINVDDDGVGGGVTDLLTAASREGRLGECVVEGVIAQSRAKDDAHYASRKAELWFSFKRLMDSEPVKIPKDPEEVKADLESHRYEIRGGKAYVEPKSLVKARLGRSPDYGDAIILTMAAGRQDYVAYKTASVRREILLASMTPDQRQQYLEDERRIDAARSRNENFARLSGQPLGRPKRTRYDDVGY